MNDTKKSSVLKKINLGVRIGVARALAEHKKEGRSIAAWKDGRVVWIPPEEITFDEELLKQK